MSSKADFKSRIQVTSALLNERLLLKVGQEMCYEDVVHVWNEKRNTFIQHLAGCIYSRMTSQNLSSVFHLCSLVLVDA